jgi:hypothetical protein
MIKFCLHDLDGWRAIAIFTSCQERSHTATSVTFPARLNCLRSSSLHCHAGSNGALCWHLISLHLPGSSTIFKVHSNQTTQSGLLSNCAHWFHELTSHSIPAEILDSFKDAAQPLEDKGLQDLVKLFDASNPDNRLRLEPTVLSQLLQIIFRLQASLLQQKLIYSLLVPPQPAQPDLFILWRRSTASKLIPTILRALQERGLGDTLLITVRSRYPTTCLVIC